MVSARDLLISSVKAMGDVLTGTDKASGGQPELAVVKRVVAAVRKMVVLAHGVILCSCIISMLCLLFYGLYITTYISIKGLMEHDHYGEADEDRINMDPAHNVLYVLCLAQGALYLYKFTLTLWLNIIVKQMSQAYGFQDGDHTVSGYCHEIGKGCLDKPSSARERNLITYAIELMESRSALGDSFLSGTLILERLLTRQHSYKNIKPPNLIEEEEEEEETQQQQRFDLKEGAGAPLVNEFYIKEESTKKSQQHQLLEQKIIGQQHRMIKRLIGSASSANILQKLLRALESRRLDDRKMRKAAARIVEHVADSICLGQLPQGIQCISALINTFDEYHRLQPHRPSSSSNTNTFSSELDSENSESESELGSDSNVNQPSLLAKVLHDCKHIVLPTLHDFWRLVTSKASNTDTTTSISKSESHNGTDQPSSSKANRSKTNPFHGYKDLVLTGLRILWSLAGDGDNCTIISNTEHLVYKIMAPTTYDLVHRAGHSAWSTMVSERSLGVMLRLIVTAKGDTRADLRRQISSDKGAITTMERIVICKECKGGELQMKAMQILTQLYMDGTSTNKGNLMKMLASIFTNDDKCDGSIRRSAGKTLVMLLLSSKSVGTLLPKEESNEFVGDLANIVLQVRNTDTCRRIATEILEHLCIHYTGNEQYLSTLKDTMTGLMPKVLREILSWLTGEEGNPGNTRSGTDVESNVTTYNSTNRNHTSSSHGQNQQHELHVALLSLCATACDKLHLDLNRISLRGGDQAKDKGECVVFSLAMKMVLLKKDLITTDNLKAMKLITRMVIIAMKNLTDHETVGERADLESLMDSLTSISENMLDLEGSMVFAAGMTTKVPAAADTLDSLVKQARQLHREIKNQE
ncbi:unnamed protein product [Alopecurus aequalis]